MFWRFDIGLMRFDRAQALRNGIVVEGKTRNMIFTLSASQQPYGLFPNSQQDRLSVAEHWEEVVS